MALQETLRGNQPPLLKPLRLLSSRAASPPSRPWGAECQGWDRCSDVPSVAPGPPDHRSLTRKRSCRLLTPQQLSDNPAYLHRRRTIATTDSIFDKSTLVGRSESPAHAVRGEVRMRDSGHELLRSPAGRRYMEPQNLSASDARSGAFCDSLISSDANWWTEKGCA